MNNYEKAWNELKELINTIPDNTCNPIEHTIDPKGLKDAMKDLEKKHKIS